MNIEYAELWKGGNSRLIPNVRDNLQCLHPYDTLFFPLIYFNVFPKILPTLSCLWFLLSKWSNDQLNLEKCEESGSLTLRFPTNTQYSSHLNHSTVWRLSN